ncbi:MAG: hypothetical protein K1060chlam2_00483 [Chlamydiae bacterium]|nr:hypothetical protein [Chlamydiota bacterium]
MSIQTQDIANWSNQRLYDEAMALSNKYYNLLWDYTYSPSGIGDTHSNTHAVLFSLFEPITVFHRLYYFITSGDIGRSIYRSDLENKYKRVVELAQATINTQNLASGSNLIASKVAKVAMGKAISKKRVAEQSARIAAHQNVMNKK